MRVIDTNASPICAAEVVLRILRGRWAMPVMVTIVEHGPIYFGAIERTVKGVSAKALAEQLRFFQKAGVIIRTPSENRREVYYELTNRGRALKSALDELNDLARRWPDL